MRTAPALALLVVFHVLAVPAFAQSTYVAGALGVDVSRLSHASSSLYDPQSSGAEVLSGALRVGTAIGTVWGVELEFTRSGNSNGDGLGFPPVYRALSPAVDAIPFPVDYRVDVRQRRSSIDAVAYARQPAGTSVDLVYLGGVAFTRDLMNITEQILPSVLLGRPIVQPTITRSTVITYGTHPLVGMEARIAMTSHLRLVPGIRVQGLPDGWIVRPSVGLGWVF